MKQLEINFDNVENATVVINNPIVVNPVYKPRVRAKARKLDPRKVLCRTQHGTLYQRLCNGQLEVIFHFPPRYSVMDVALCYQRESMALVSYLEHSGCLNIA